MSHSHILISRHQDTIGSRSRQLRSQLRPVLGITWNMRGRSFVPLGTATMMAMSYHEQRIELSAVTARMVGHRLIEYGDVRMSHNFAIRPQAGRWKALDPRDADEPGVTPRDRPNASWVRLALGVDAHCVAGSAQPHTLPVVPQLPVFWAGFRGRASCVPAVSTHAARTLLSGLGRSPQEAETMSLEDISRLIGEHWDRLWVAPDAEGNTSGLWLIRTEFVGRLQYATRIFEDFRHMLGVECPNPTLGLVDVKYVNPARRCASRRGITLRDAADAARLTEEQEQELMADVRQELRAHRHEFCDEEIRQFVRNPAKPVLLPFCNGSLIDLDVEAVGEQIRSVVLVRHPELYDSLTEEDIFRAIEQPNLPLRVAGACPIQVLAWNTELTPDEAFRFPPQVLERPGVAANLWPGEEFHVRQKGGHRGRRARAAAAAK